MMILILYVNLVKLLKNKYNYVKYIDYHKAYWKVHGAAKSARQKAEKLQAIPPWANLVEIADMYFNCPKGYHVDHIYPLRGKNTCGLHVENNLQYLTAEDNLKKSNKLPDECPFIPAAEE